MKRSITVRVNRRVISIVAGDCAILIQEMQKSYPGYQMRFLLYPKNNYQPFLHEYDRCMFNMPTSI